MSVRLPGDEANPSLSGQDISLIEGGSRTAAIRCRSRECIDGNGKMARRGARARVVPTVQLRRASHRGIPIEPCARIARGRFTSLITTITAVPYDATYQVLFLHPRGRSTAM